MTEKFEKDQFRDFKILLPDEQNDETLASTLNHTHQQTINNEPNAENDGRESDNNSDEENEGVEDEEIIESD